MEYETVDVWIKIGKELKPFTRYTKIYVFGSRGTIVSSGIPIIFKRGKWIYEPK